MGQRGVARPGDVAPVSVAVTENAREGGTWEAGGGGANDVTAVVVGLG